MTKAIMPNFKSGNFKQKNKPFKGAKKQKEKFKGVASAVPAKSKKIQKEKSKVTKSVQKANRKNEKKALQFAKQMALTQDTDRTEIIKHS